MTVFWDVRRCSMVHRYHNSRELAASIFYPEYGGSRILQNTCNIYTVSHSTT